MTSMQNSPGKTRFLSARRVALLASAAAIGAAVALGAPGFVSKNSLPTMGTAAYAQQAARPVGFADIVERVKPAVISVRVKRDGGPRTMSFSDDLQIPPGSQLERFFRRFGMPDGMPNMPRGRGVVTGQGSGFFISADGYAVTNNHVVDKAEKVEITTDDGKSYDAKVIGSDPRTDIALIKVEGGKFPFVNFADRNARIGDWVLAVGNPFGLGGTVTAGIVSARGRDIGAGPYDDFIQIDAPVNRGNSGGPTFDVDGNVIGVNTAIFSPSGGNVGIAFAIPAETVKTVVGQLRDKGTVTRGWIGVQIQPVTPDIADSLGLKKQGGALVSEPQPNSPALKAGIEAGDVITSVNGAEVRDARELARRIGSMAPGTSVKLSLMRKGEEKTITLTLGELPNMREARASTDGREMPGSDGTRLGMMLAPAGTMAGAGTNGVVVTGIDPGSLAEELGMRTGDVILEVAGKTVATPADVRKLVTDARKEGKRSVLMRVKSGEATKFVAMPLGRA